MASTRLLTLLGPSIIRNFSPVPSTHFNKTCILPSLRFKRYSSSASCLDSVSPILAVDNSSAHPWPEWINFVDGLKAKGYLPQNPTNDGHDAGPVVYTEAKLVKEACLNFARDRFDIFKLLSGQDVQTVVERGCPNILRKAVNSAKRLRAYLDVDEGEVCGSCNLRGSCDRAYVMLNGSEAAARTVDVVRILLLYALDPIVISEEIKPPGRELVYSAVRKLLKQLIELGETQPNPDLPKPASVTSQRKNGSSRDAEMKHGDWVCSKCNFMNFARNTRCRECKAEGPIRVSVEVEMKKGDWNCPRCNFMNFSRNTRCRKCNGEVPKSVSVDEVEMKKGDWNCPQCSFMNFSSKRQCFRCHVPRPEKQCPEKQLRPGDWECPDCDFLNFGRNNVCRKCNHDRPQEESVANLGTWEKPY